jgi:hypothetical protein
MKIMNKILSNFNYYAEDYGDHVIEVSHIKDLHYL